MDGFESESMLDVFIFETNKLIDELEEIFLRTEKTGFTSEDINDVFRCMHTIKGSSAMMELNNISGLTHVAENLFAFIRDNQERDFSGEEVTDLILRVVDFVKQELILLQKDKYIQTNADTILNEVEIYISKLKNAKITKKLKVHLFFEDGCKMENIRAFGVLKSIEDIVYEIETIPSSLDYDESADEISNNGFTLTFTTEKEIDEVKNVIQRTMFIKSLVIDEIKKSTVKIQNIDDAVSLGTNNYVSVDVSKLDRLLDIVGELVISESMLAREDMDSEYEKAFRLLTRMTDELQNSVMQVRMLPVYGIFHKMQRAVRDLSKKTGKDISLVINGADTEVDKRVLDNLSEPLIHIIRNAVDHGIEEKDERVRKGKSATGKITLEAYNEGGEVIIAVIDDGKGLDKDKIIQKALNKGLINSTELSDSEAYNLITLPGFSTNDEVTELSGRGVGMDVVKQEMMKVGGKLYIESEKDRGTAIVMKYPLTLVIVDGIGIKVGSEIYVIPALNIKEIFTAREAKVINTKGKEMILLRNELYPLVWLGKNFNTLNYIEDINQCQMCLVKKDDKLVCLIVDRVISKQKIVVKPLPQYLLSNFQNLTYFSGCTITGDGKTRLILDINAF